MESCVTVWQLQQKKNVCLCKSSHKIHKQW